MDLFNRFSHKKTCRILADESSRVARKYKHFKEFLDHNHACLSGIADLENLYHGGAAFEMEPVRSTCDGIIQAAHDLTRCLNQMAEGRYEALLPAVEKITAGIRRRLAERPDYGSIPFVLPLDDVRRDMVGFTGSKAANLAAVRNDVGLPVPAGFVITAAASLHFFDHNQLMAAIETALAGIAACAPEERAERCRALQEKILAGSVPTALASAIRSAFDRLAAEAGGVVHVAVRSSAVGEDTAASFAGQYHTELNVAADGVLDAYKLVLASKYSERAVLYRLSKGFDEWDTPMAVLCVAMVSSRHSGVMYTRDPSSAESETMKVGVTAGMGEGLVSGEVSGDILQVDRSTGRIASRESAGQTSELNIDLRHIEELAQYGLRVERFFEAPQDIEWALDPQGKVFILQSRPISFWGVPQAADRVPVALLPDHPILLQEGRPASPGVASGVAFIAEVDVTRVPENCILVARSASPEYAKFMDSLNGIITDFGSPASHLASVAREFGVPAVFGTRVATQVIRAGMDITLTAENATVYQGLISSIRASGRSGKKAIFESPMSLRLRAVLDDISPLNLTDPESPDFSPEGCRTLHDIVRFAHEKAVQAMFGMATETDDSVVSARLSFNIPILLHFIDLGGGLSAGLTSCDSVTPDHIESIPMKALWKGLSHPGINWSSAVNLDFHNLMTVMASSAVGGGGLPGGDSYAIVTEDYLNLSVKFGYHFANVDAFCGANPGQNYITLKFGGGVGAYYGKLLRIGFLTGVLRKLGFAVRASGDILEAQVSGLDRLSTEEALDQLGRLLATSRLLDVGIRSQQDVDEFMEAFFRGEYDLLNLRLKKDLPGFHTPIGDWELAAEAEDTVYVQDGSRWAGAVSAKVAGVMTRMMGAKYQQFLDTIDAYFHFPLAIAKDSFVEKGEVSLQVKPTAGKIDQAGGLAFGIRNIGNYFVLRVNALEDNLILFEFVNSRRFERQSVARTIKTGQWHRLRVVVDGSRIAGFLNDELLIEHTAARSAAGHVGLWTKADSVTSFKDLRFSTAR
jgi:pyruvate,water dikinase